MGRHRRVMVLRALATIAVAVLIGAVVWVDLTTAVWQDVVVLSGIAAGLLTVVLTALILEPMVARSEHRRTNACYSPRCWPAGPGSWPPAPMCARSWTTCPPWPGTSMTSAMRPWPLWTTAIRSTCTS